MDKSSPMWFSSTTLCLIIILASCTPASAMDTLYSFDEPVAQLDMSNFTETVLGSESAWAVEFYATWCGHCQRMAPIWLEFAREVQDWHKVVRVAAVACSAPVNAPLCRLYNVWGYPTIKFFSANATAERGHSYNGEKTADAIREAVLQYVTSHPLLQPQRRAADLLTDEDGNERTVFVVAVDHRDQQQKLLAQQAVLDGSGKAGVVVGWLDYFASRAHGVLEVPSLHRVDGHGMLTPVPLTTVNRSTILEAVRAVLGDEDTAVIPEPDGDQDQDKDFSDAQYIIPSGVHMQDLESGLYYSLYVEVAAKPALDTEARAALHQHISLLNKYIPYRESIQLFLNRTLDWLGRQHGNISGQLWLQALQDIQEYEAYIPRHIRWAGCLGTLPKYRGYPCSVWQSYHVLTVAAYLQGAGDPAFDPTAVLATMRSYVDHFLGCRDCAEHFVNMAVNLEENVNNRYDGVLWLWRSHNEVNNRLQGDATEDPNHPKVQFPIKEACPDCRIEGSGEGMYDNETAWHIGKVIGYLTRFYDPMNVIDDSSGQGFSETAIQYHGQPPHTISHNIAWRGGGEETTQKSVFPGHGNSSAVVDRDSEEERMKTVDRKPVEDAVEEEALGETKEPIPGERNEELDRRGEDRRREREHREERRERRRKANGRGRKRNKDRTKNERNRENRRSDQNADTTENQRQNQNHRGRDHTRDQVVHRTQPGTTEPSVKLDDKQALIGTDLNSNPRRESLYNEQSNSTFETSDIGSRDGKSSLEYPSYDRRQRVYDRRQDSDGNRRTGYSDAYRRQGSEDSSRSQSNRTEDVPDTDIYRRQDSRDPYGREDSRDPYGTQDNRDPYGRQNTTYTPRRPDSSDPNGRQDNPYGRPESRQDSRDHDRRPDTRDPYRRQDTRDPSGRQNTTYTARRQGSRTEDTRDPHRREDNRDPSGRQDNPYGRPESRPDTRDPYGTQDTRDPYGTQESSDPYSRQDSRDHDRRPDTRDPSGRQDSRDPYGTQDSRDPYSRQDSRDHDGRPDTRDTSGRQDNQHGRQDSRDPYGTQDTRDPYGRQDTRDSSGTQDTRDSYGTQDTRDPYGTQDTRDPYGTQGTSDPYGTQDTRDPYGTQDTRDSYGTQDSRDPYGTQDTRHHDRRPDSRDPNGRQNTTYTHRRPDSRDPSGRQDNPYGRSESRQDSRDHDRRPDNTDSAGRQDPYGRQGSRQDNRDPYGTQDSRDPYGRQDNPYRRQESGQDTGNTNPVDQWYSRYMRGPDSSNTYGRQDGTPARQDSGQDRSNTNPVDRWYSRYMRGYAGVSRDPYSRSSSRSSAQNSNSRYSVTRSSNQPRVPVHGSSRNVGYVGSRPCVLRSTEWTACSKSCDTGTSSRFTNNNEQCEMRQDVRLCLLRPCRARFQDWSLMDWNDQQCPQFGSTYRAASPVSLRHGGCHTRVQKLWRYCGMCPSKCCYPKSSRTEAMDMICAGGKTAIVKVMIFDFCECASTCPAHYK